jgi:hypothetical protein
MPQQHNFNQPFIAYFDFKGNFSTMKVEADSWKSATEIIASHAEHNPQLGTLVGIVRDGYSLRR